jgi:threonine/homoserine/homoserine lactone efflux protein
LLAWQASKGIPAVFEVSAYLTFVLACAAVIVVPGPTVTVIVANSLRHGARAGLANVAGTQAGLAVMLAVLAAGLQIVVEALGVVFEVVKLLGAAYLIYLGAKLLLSRSALSARGGEAALAEAGTAPAFSWRSYFWQGFLVIWANPKALLFFGAFIPQFVSAEGPVVAQTLALGLTFMTVATLLDGGYALLAGRAGGWLTRRRVRLLEVCSGCFLVGGGVWLALTRR